MPKSALNKRQGVFTSFYTFKCRSSRFENKDDAPSYRGETWKGYIRWLKLHQKKCDCVEPYHFRRDGQANEEGHQVSNVPVMRQGVQIGETVVNGGHIAFGDDRLIPVDRMAFMNADTGLIHNSHYGRRVPAVRTDYND